MTTWSKNEGQYSPNYPEIVNIPHTITFHHTSGEKADIPIYIEFVHSTDIFPSDGVWLVYDPLIRLIKVEILPLLTKHVMIKYETIV